MSGGGAVAVDLFEDSDDIYPEVLEKKVVQGKVQYLIQRAGFSDAENTWEPEENISSLAIELFEKREEERRMNPSVEAAATTMEPEADQRKNPEQTLEKIRSQSEASSSSDEETQGSVYHGLEPEAIRGATDVTGELLLGMEFRGIDELQLVPAKVANVKWPQMVIAFYEERLTFSTDPMTD